MKVGHLRQVVPDALTFAWTLVAEGTEARGRRIADRGGPGRRRLPRVRDGERMGRVPAGLHRLRELDVELVRGEELLVDALNIEEVPSGRC